MKRFLMISILLFSGYLFAQAGPETKTNPENGKKTWYLTNSSKTKAKVELKKTVYDCDGSVKTYTSTKTAYPGRELYLDVYHKVCFSDGKKGYNEYTALSVKKIE
ncbi:hypothetical protein [Dokdonia sp. Hel_I_53]|uniref:hypothetical protein n=1 Tax=Dokdonia sp. Hel_I_53 TaxID=1566287 RepID=UPI0011998EAD|nr:hypothetical protein [Dokdonia sp. Hel_I_53]TVZ52845.1 hypothetical protein OD90_2030 [Dokdonia sp. Hel_I_53]